MGVDTQERVMGQAIAQSDPSGNAGIGGVPAAGTDHVGCFAEPELSGFVQVKTGSAEKDRAGFTVQCVVVTPITDVIVLGKLLSQVCSLFCKNFL